MKLKITVHGVAYEVAVEVLEALDEMTGSAAPLPSVTPAAGTPPTAGAPTASGSGVSYVPPLPRPAAPGSANGVASPIAGTVLEVKVKVGDQVVAGQDLLVIEAMKMETAIAARAAGTVKTVLVAPGDSVRETQTLIEFT